MWDKEALDNWLPGAFSSKQKLDKVESHESSTTSLNNSFSFLEIGSNKEKSGIEKKSKPSYLRNLKRSQKEELPETTWKRVIVADGIEVNIRSDIQNKSGEIISKWIGDLKKNIPKEGG